MKEVVLVLQKARIISWNDITRSGQFAYATPDGDVAFISFSSKTRQQLAHDGNGNVYLSGTRVTGGQFRLRAESLVYVSMSDDGKLKGWCTSWAYDRELRRPVPKKVVAA